VAQARLQMLGLCRFSYPTAQDGFSRTGKTLSEQRAILYDPARMALRLFYFEHVMLPGIRAQDDPDFTLLLLMGDQLPGDVRARVLELIADIPQIRPVFAPEGQAHRKVCSAVMQDARDASAAAVAEFILDDDDGVAIDFVSRTRVLFPRMRGLMREATKLVLDYNRGILLSTVGGTPEFHSISAPYWTPASCLLMKPDSSKSIQDFRHTRVWQRVPTVTMPLSVMFLRGAHGDNDSSVSERPAGAVARPMEPQVLNDVLTQRFALDIGALNAAWRRLNA